MVFLWLSEFNYSLVEPVILNPLAVKIISIFMVIFSFATCLSAVLYQFLQYDRSTKEVEKYLTSQVESSELKFKSIFEQASVGVVFADLKGEIIDCNERYSTIYGILKIKLIGMNVRDLMKNEVSETNRIEFRNLVEGKKNHVTMERQVTRTDGSKIWCSINAARINDQSGNSLYIAAFLQDISEQKKLQENIVYSSSMASLGEMSAGLAHEINTPLAIINARAWLMLERLQTTPSAPPELAVDIDKVIMTTERIAKIVKGLLSFSRGESTEPLDYADLSSLVDDVRALCEQRFKMAGINFIVDPVPIDFAQCRKHQIEQVLLNLLNNAFDAVSDLPEKWVRLSVVAESQSLKFIVTDSGAGIPEAIIKKMMQPFFTTKVIGKGTGLGLSISKGIIEHNGGTLEVNRNSKNTCFVIILPTRLKSEKIVA